jgi:hypothetical protein
MSTHSKSIADNNRSENLSTSSEERQQPIPSPSHPRQYRAIGLIRAIYQMSGEQLTQGILVTPEGTEIEAVLLGRVISLVKKHLDLAKEHLWVVYPRTKAKSDCLHVQIVGVWEPETLSQTSTSTPSSNEMDDGYFSIRGEVIFYSQEKEAVIVKIKQFPRKEGEKPKFFKLRLKGKLRDRPLHRFWDLKVRLDGETLKIEQGTDLGFITKQKPRGKPRQKRPIDKRPPQVRKSTPISRPTPPVKKAKK